MFVDNIKKLELRLETCDVDLTLKVKSSELKRGIKSKLFWAHG